MWYLRSCIIITTQRPAGKRTPLSSKHISEERAARSHEGAIAPCLAMRRQHVLTNSQQSERVCVCLQPKREQISQEPLNGTYKLIAKWLKSLDCYLSVSRQEALCHGSMRPASPLLRNHLVFCGTSGCSCRISKKNRSCILDQLHII